MTASARSTVCRSRSSASTWCPASRRPAPGRRTGRRSARWRPRSRRSSATSCSCWSPSTASSSTSCSPRPTSATSRPGPNSWPAHRALLVLGDKGYLRAPVAAALLAEAGSTLLTVPRKHQRAQLPPALAALHARWRQIVETVNGQLAELFRIEENRAHSFGGLRARLYGKLTAHTLGIYLNRLLGNPDCLHLKALAYPI